MAATSQLEPSLTTHLSTLRMRLLEGITFYPMLIQLMFSLAAIRVTHSFGVWGWIACMLSTVTVGTYLLAQRLSRASHSRPLWLCTFWMMCIASLFAWNHHRSNLRIHQQLAQWHALHSKENTLNSAQATWKPVVLRGFIEQTVRLRQRTSYDTDETLAWQSQTILRTHSLQHTPQHWSPLQLDVHLVVDGNLTGFYPGDEVQLYGTWRRPLEPSNPGQFDVRNRYAELGLAAQVQVDSTSLIRKRKDGTNWRIDRWLARWTESSLHAMNHYVPLNQAPLTAALVLGQREQADWDLQVEMLATGTIHMMSISGMHIEMVAGALLLIGWLLHLPRGPVFFGTVCLCILYASLCGANPPVARATIMLTCGLLARYLGWAFSGLNILAFAALILLAQRTSIAFDVGSQLSFLTVAVLILTFPILRRNTVSIERLIESKHSTLERILRGTKEIVRESIRSSFWVCFLSAPLVWASFHIISPIAVLFNLVLWLPMLIALLAGLGLVLLFWIPPIAWFCGLLCGISLSALELAVTIGYRIPYGHLWSAAPPTWWLIGFYAIALLIAIARGTRKIQARRELIWGLSIWFACGGMLVLTRDSLSPWKYWRGQGTLTITFLDVGHGSCVLIQSPSGKSWLYDAGRLGDPQRSHQAIANALWEMGINHLDGIILSHADSDHYNAIPGLLERFSVSRFATTQVTLEHHSATLQALLASVRKQRIPIEVWDRSASYTASTDCSWKILFPTQPDRQTALVSIPPKNKKRTKTHLNDNATSLCIAIEYAGYTILLPGDLEEPGTSQLLSFPQFDCDVLMAPHHGSLTTHQSELFRWATPETVIISGSERSVSPEVFQTYAPNRQQVLHTARDHALQLVVESNGTTHWYRWTINRWQPIHSLIQK